MPKTRFESQFARRYCQIFSTGLSSGERDGRKTRERFFGTMSFSVVSRSKTSACPRITNCSCADHAPVGATTASSIRNASDLGQ